MCSAPKARDKIEGVDVVVSTKHVTFLTNKFSRLISLPTFTIFVSGTSGITAILKYRSVNPISVLCFDTELPFCEGLLTDTKRLFNWMIRLFFIMYLFSISCHICIHSLKFTSVVNMLLIRQELFYIVQHEEILNHKYIFIATIVWSVFLTLK